MLFIYSFIYLFNYLYLSLLNQLFSIPRTLVNLTFKIEIKPENTIKFKITYQLK